ncbi:protein FMC1 homolog [Halyomorpha halys]|uniref:protein FMC1 homolog n=1 Tax=Halyomorpha halys TaxID=286706 RepID=UPI0006D50247|nr:protein FMC1 homolog [Halyomorpha halys]
MSQNVHLLRHLLSELRKVNSNGKLKDSNIVNYIFHQYRRFGVTDQMYCRAQDEMKCVANTYVTYLQSIRRFKELVRTYHSAGERSVEDTANIVGFKLPHDPK